MGYKTYKSVVEMVRDLTNDAELIDTVDDALDRQEIVRQLMAMRVVRGLSQCDIAERMDCSQSRVSKIENSADDDLRYGDLRRYAEAVGAELRTIARPKDIAPTDEVRMLAFAVNDRLSRMAELARSDDDIAKGVAKFFAEAFFNFSMIVGRAASALPRNPDGSPRIAVHVDFEPAEESDPPTETIPKKKSLPEPAAS